MEKRQMIDSNNQFNKLSRSLIDATRNIMEKKTNKHGHDAVGDEDPDIDNDGDIDKSDAYLHNRRKAIAKSMKKEEVEEIEELSEPTVRNYYNKAGEQGKKIADKMKMGGGDWSKDGKDTDTLKKRAAGRKMALKRRSGEVKMSEDSINEKDAPHVKDFGPYGDRASSAKEKMIANFNKPKNKNEKPNWPQNKYRSVFRPLKVVSDEKEGG